MGNELVHTYKNNAWRVNRNGVGVGVGDSVKHYVEWMCCCTASTKVQSRAVIPAVIYK